MRADFIIENIGEMATPLGHSACIGARMSEIRRVHDAVIAAADGCILYAGPAKDADFVPGAKATRIDAGGRAVVPGLVDSHTHLPFAGDRSNEFLMRLQGKSYQEIAAAGGGIASTVRATREITEDALLALCRGRLASMLRHGSTTVEAKSGYGLNLEDELKQLRVLRRLTDSHGVSIVTTCMCAHDVPQEFKNDRAAYIDLIESQILPAVRDAGLARFFDIFVETGVYTRDEGERLCRRAASLGFLLKIHADEFGDTGGAGLAAEVGAVSAEHLLYASEDGIRRMAAAGVVATLLPGVPFFLMLDRYAPARAMIDAGVAVAIATDFNPGSSYTESMPTILQMASFGMKLRIEEALTAATLNAAHALRQADTIGSLEPGKWLDALILEGRSFVDLVYHYGVNPVERVIKRGVLVADNRTGAAASLSAPTAP